MEPLEDHTVAKAPLLAMTVANLEDAATLRVRAGALAELTLADHDARFRLATAVSEVAQVGLIHGTTMDVAFHIEDGPPPQALIASVSFVEPDGGALASAEALRDLSGLQGTVDILEIGPPEGEGAYVLIGTMLPERATPYGVEDVARWRGEMDRLAMSNPLEELWHQNQSLLKVIDDIQKLSKRLSKNESFLKAIIDAIPNPVFYTDSRGRYLGCNRAFCIAFGIERADVPGKRLRDVFTGPEVERLERALVEALASRRPQVFECPLPFADGSDRHVLFSQAAFVGPDDAPAGVVGVISDVTTMKRLEVELRRLATTDPLTGSANRRHFMEYAWRELSRHRRYKAPLALLVMDVDHFKSVNDTYGHAVGDEMLKTLVTSCLGALREVDMLGRLGGEEFAVILPHTDLDQALFVAERLRKRFEDVRVALATGRKISGTVSIGVTDCELDGDSIESMLHRADRALYKAKDRGRNRVAPYLPVEDEKIVLA